jgi:hypothetical protein
MMHPVQDVPGAKYIQTMIREPRSLETIVVGVATVLSRTIIFVLRWLGILLLILVGFFVGIVIGVLKRK